MSKHIVDHLIHKLYGMYVPCRYVGNDKNIPTEVPLYVNSCHQKLTTNEWYFNVSGKHSRKNLKSEELIKISDGRPIKASDVVYKSMYSIQKDILKKVPCGKCICINERLKTLNFLEVYEYKSTSSDDHIEINGILYSSFNFIFQPLEMVRDDTLSKILGDSKTEMEEILCKKETIDTDQVMFRETLRMLKKSFSLRLNCGSVDEISLEEIFLEVVKGNKNKKEITHIFYNLNEYFKKYVK